MRVITSSLEEVRDLDQISVSELINALQATEQRRSIRNEESVESALLAKQKSKATVTNFPKKQSGERRDKGKGIDVSSRDGEK